MLGVQGEASIHSDSMPIPAARLRDGLQWHL